MCLIMTGGGGSFAQNPFFETPFFADPTARVVNGRIYLYPSHDAPVQKSYRDMDGYHVLSSEDLVHWTDHGQFLHSTQIDWVAHSMWAPDGGVQAPDGSWLYYFPARDNNNRFHTGVVSSAVPEMKNWTGGGIIEGVDGIDPAVFIDDDGQAYLYSGAEWVVRLKPNLREAAGEKIVMKDIGTPPQNPIETRGNRPSAAPLEAQWVFKRNGIYYRIYNGCGNRCHWTTADGPTGPWTYGGPLMNADLGGAQGHGSIVEYNGQWYYFYHITSPARKEGVPPQFARAACADIVYFNDDGSIQEVIPTRYGVGRYDGSKRIEAESFFEKTAGMAYRQNSGGGYHAYSASAGQTLRFPKVDFGVHGKRGVSLMVKTDRKTILRFSTGKTSVAMPVDAVPVWQTVRVQFEPQQGVQDIQLAFDGPGEAVSLDWFELY